MLTTRHTRFIRAALGSAVLGGMLVACTGGGGEDGGAGQAGITGQMMAKPGGELFFVDPNRSGSVTEVRIAEISWGRLVDLHALDAANEPLPTPKFRDLVVNENIQTDGFNYRLDTNPITQKTRLTVLRQETAADFDALVADAQSGLGGILPQNDDGSTLGPFSYLARNACLVLRFTDCLADDDTAARDLFQTVQVRTGYPPSVPFGARVVFDPNHGAVFDGEFHSTRVLVDMTVSESEQVDMPVPQPINSLGLTPSLAGTSQPNISIRIPTRIDFGSGQFEVLRGLSGAPLSFSSNTPTDGGSPTADVVRALRSGNAKDTNSGFLLDLSPPEILGTWSITLSNVRHDTLPSATFGFDFIADLEFETACEDVLEEGDILAVGGLFLEVRTTSSAPVSGEIDDIELRSLTRVPIVNPSLLVGTGSSLTTFDPRGGLVPIGCWLSFAPRPSVVPVTDVTTDAQVIVQFTEPMNPDTVTPFGTFMVVRGDANTPVGASNIVVGSVNPTVDLRQFIHRPVLPLSHAEGFDEAYHVRLAGPTDLAGNGLKNQLPRIDFRIDPTEASELNGGVVMRFNSIDELEPIGANDLRGQIFYDLDNGLIRPRPVQFQSYPVDRNAPVPSIMIPFPPGIQTPLSPLGSKMHTVWRYVDLGWQVRDETKYNLDVVGLSWSPVSGRLLSDFYEEFEIRLSHARKQPDEDIDAFLLPRFASSGLIQGSSTYTQNVLNDPLSPQKTVHPRQFGYLIDPLDQTTSVNGVALAPFPMNRTGQPLVTFTWRDTGALGVGAPQGRGIPLGIEIGAPLNLEPNGSLIWPAGVVPTFGLPLLMEFRCYPSDSGVGLNAFDISLAINSSVRPNFRSYSTGGVNTRGKAIKKNPDLELTPSGGFNPTSRPNPGKTTRFDADNSFYIGQLDTVTRISRAHTIWIDTKLNAAKYAEPVYEPSRDTLPVGTSLIIEFRGAKSFVNSGGRPFDAQELDPYGNYRFGTVRYLTTKADWRTRLPDFDGARYFQLRLSFINNIQALLNAEISGIGVAFFADS